MNAAKMNWSVGIVIAVLAVVPVGCSQDWSSVCPAKGTTVLSVYTPARSLSEQDEATASRKGDRDMALGAGDTVVWYGTTDDDWEVVTNWSPQEIPIDQVHVVVSAAAVSPMLTNLDRQGDSGGDGLDLRTFYTEPGLVEDVGTPTNPLKCTVDHPTNGEPSIRHYGKGSLNFSSETGTGGHTTGYIIVRSPNMDNAAVITGDEAITGLICLTGHTTLSSDFTDTLGYLFARRWSHAAVEPVVVLEAHVVATVNSIWQRAGIITARRPVNVLSLDSGQYVHEQAVLANLRMAGGQFTLRPISATTGISAATLMDGWFNATGMAHNVAIVHLWKFPEVVFSSDHRLSIDTEYKLFGEDTE